MQFSRVIHSFDLNLTVIKPVKMLEVLRFLNLTKNYLTNSASTAGPPPAMDNNYSTIFKNQIMETRPFTNQLFWENDF